MTRFKTTVLKECISDITLVVWKYIFIDRARRRSFLAVLELSFMVVVFYGVWDESPSAFRKSPGNTELGFKPWDPLNIADESRAIFAYAPMDDFVDDLATIVADVLRIPERFAVESEEALMEFMESGSEFQQKMVIAVHFNVTPTSNFTYTVLAKRAKFSLSLMEDISLARTPGLKNIKDTDEIKVLLPLEAAIERTCASLVAELNHVTLPEIPVRMQQFPNLMDNRIEDNVDAEVSTLSLRWLIGFALPFCALIITVTNEAQTGLKDLLWLNGLWKSIYWLGHFLNALVMVLPAIMLILAALFLVPNDHDATYYVYSDATLVFAFLFLFSVLSLLHAMVLSIFFSPAWAIAAAVVYWIFAAMFPFIVSHHLSRIDSTRISRNVKFFTSISPFMSLHWCFRSVEKYEMYRIGARWSNFHNRKLVRDDVSIAEVMLLGLTCCCLQVVLLWWLELPRTHPVTTRLDRFEAHDATGDQLPLIDPDARLSMAVVELHTVTVCRDDVKELNDISVTICDREITVFLGAADSGHNTVLDIMVGKQRPDEGQVLVGNASVVSSPEKVHKLVSFCPKSSVAFSDLTVEENLQFFALLRLSSSAARRAVARIISDMNLGLIKDMVVGKLNESKRRVTNVAIAMVVASDVRVVILQEPTWNMDLEARQDVWEMLLAQSRKLSIVMTTHDVEEANVLGHRIVIMRKGCIVCCGSLAWIRQKFGTGYRLHITKTAMYSQAKVEKCIMKHMGIVSLCLSDAATAVYILGPVPVARKVMELLEELEDNTAGIKSVSVSVTSLEDIFVRISSGSNIQNQGTDVDDSGPTPEPSPGASEPPRNKDEPRNKFAASLAEPWNVQPIFSVRRGHASSFVIIHCLFHKRYLSITLRSTRYLFRYFLPVVLIFLSKLVEYILVRSVVDVPRTSLSYNSTELLRNSQGFLHRSPTASNSTGFVRDQLEPLMTSEGVHLIWVSDNRTLDEVMSFNQSNMRQYRYQFGVSVSDDVATLWYSGKGSARVALIVTDLYYSSLLRAASGGKDVRFEFVHRLDDNQTKQQLTEIELGRSFRTRLLSQQLLLSFYVPMSACFHTASFVFVPLEERVSKAKLLQLMTGVSGLIYWMTNLMFDVVFEIPAAVVFALMVCFDVLHVGLAEVGAIVLLFFLYALSAISMTYLFTFMFDSPASCFISVALILFASGVAGSHCVFAQGLVKGWVPDALLFLGGYLGRLLPSYQLSRGVAKATSLKSGLLICAQGGDILNHCCTDYALTYWVPVLGECCTTKDIPRVNVFSLYYLGCGSQFLFLFLQALLFLVALSLLDSSLRQSIASHWGHTRPGTYLPSHPLQKTVLNQNVEREAALAKYIVRTHERLQWSLVAVDLTQWSCSATTSPIENVSLTVGQDECIGVLGVPYSSGKSSLLSVLAGEAQLVSGDAYMPNLSLLSNMKAWQTRMGFCPQEGGLLPCLSANDMVAMFARLRGIPVNEALDVAKLLFRLLGLRSPKKPCASFSFTDRRKVSLVIAILGSPSLLLLDDPCHGTDPIGRTRIRHLLRSIHECHKMPMIIAMKWAHPEATFLDRVAVMESGKLESLASIQELADNFGRGACITIQVPPRSPAYERLQRDITDAMRRTFRTCELYTSQHGLLTYHVKKVSDEWNVLFRKMISLNRKFHFQEFHVSDMTLQNAFSQLTKRHLYGTGGTGATYSPGHRPSAEEI